MYGPYQVSELVLGMIWQKIAFDSARMKDSRGRQIEVLNPGRWNRLAGPDFKDAIFRIDGDRVGGDVEIHFSQSDWKAHGHDKNPNFDRVVLHVVYHSIRWREKPVLTVSGGSVPTVSLMELLWYDSEEYSTEDFIIESTGGSVEDAFLSLLDLSITQRRNRLIEGVADRWKLKRDFAKMRIERLGWDEACHMNALEIMGLRGIAVQCYMWQEHSRPKGVVRIVCIFGTFGKRDVVCGPPLAFVPQTIPKSGLSSFSNGFRHNLTGRRRS